MNLRVELHGFQCERAARTEAPSQALGQFILVNCTALDAPRSGFRGGGRRRSGSWSGGASGTGSALYGRHQRQREQLAKDCRGDVRALQGLAGAGRQTARDRRDDPGTHGSAGALSGGVGAPATLGSGSRLGKRIRKRCVRSRAWREKSTAAVWKGQRDGRVRRRGGTPSQCITVIVAETGAGSSARRRRSGWSRCGSSTESKLTRRMMRAMEEARQEKARQAERARQMERARLEWARQETARSRERRGPERGGPERDYGPSR